MDIPRVNSGKWEDVSILAACTDKEQMKFSFKHACAYLSIEVSEADITAGYNKFQLARASGTGRLFGTQAVSFDQEGNIILGDSTEDTGDLFLTLQYFESAGTYYFPVIAGQEYEGGLILGRNKDGHGLLKSQIQRIQRGHVARCGQICQKMGNPRIYIKPDGTGEGSSWEDAADMDFVQQKLTACAAAPQSWLLTDTYFCLKGNETYETNLEIDNESDFMILGCYEGSGTPGTRDTSAYKTVIRQKSADKPIVTISGTAGKPTLYGLTFCDAKITGTGSAVHITSGSEVRIRACTFQNNEASTHGGALDIDHNSAKVYLYEGCRFKNNTAKNGGAIRLNGTSAKLDIKDSFFSGNKGESATYGGGCLYLTKGQATVSNCRFERNSATNFGGTACITGGQHNFTNAIFEDNSSAKEGGCLYLSNGSCTATDCSFEGNSATTNGGVVYATGGTHSFTSCSFSGNSATYGGAISVNRTDTDIPVSVALHGGTLSGNIANNATSNLGGGAIYMNTAAKVQCDGTAFIGNKVVSSLNSRGGAICMRSDQGAVLMANACVFKGNGFEITGSTKRAVFGSAVACQNGANSNNYNDAGFYNCVFTDGFTINATSTGIGSLMLTGSGICVNCTTVESASVGDVVRFATPGSGRAVLYNSIVLDKVTSKASLSAVTSSGYVLSNKFNTNYTAADTDYAAETVETSLGLDFTTDPFGAWSGTAPAGYTKGADAAGARAAIRSHSGIGEAFDEWLLSIDPDIYSKSGNGATRTAPFWPGAYQN